jgi:uncharacterized protein YgbK (DUF1537 family)
MMFVLDAPLYALDDDPTGTQAVTDARVVCRWDGDQVARAAAGAPGSIHLLTNSRALEPGAARRVTADAARAVRAAAPSAWPLLRGDSTLRAHVAEEYDGLLDAYPERRGAPLVLVPALPAAGRVTVGGRHFQEHPGGGRTALEDTEYARDPAFAYTTAELLAWAAERSGGRFRRDAGQVVALTDLRRSAGMAVAQALAAAGPESCVALDAETDTDLELIATGLRAAPPAVVRCAPALVSALAGNAAHGLADPGPISGGVLVCVGSFVSLATRQLAALRAAAPTTTVEVDARALSCADAAAEIARVAARVRAAIAPGHAAVVATPRTLDRSLDSLTVRARLADNLAAVVAHCHEAAGAVVAKGGITSAVTVTRGLGATLADVLGPIAPGVALWRTLDGPGRGTPYAIVPGNVGDDDLLATVVRRLLHIDDEAHRARIPS